MTQSLSLCVLTISDSRNRDTDSAGNFLMQALTEAGHNLHAREICMDDKYRIRALLSQWIADPTVDGILCTGGTGFTGRDSTPEAVQPLLDKAMPGFGELFRQLSFADIGTSSLQSRALAGLANGVFVFCLPGSLSACQLAWNSIIRAQLDSTTKPCNLVSLKPRLQER
jgi:molybdenum cofactor biosynthesis protein B